MSRPHPARLPSNVDNRLINLEDRFEIYGLVRILGPAKGITISGNNTFRLMYVRGLTMENVTVMKGNGEFGSAIEAGHATVLHTTVRDNSGPSSAVYVGQSPEQHDSPFAAPPLALTAPTLPATGRPS